MAVPYDFGGIETVQPEEMNQQILAGDDGVRIRPDLAVGPAEAERFVEGDRVVERRTG